MKNTKVTLVPLTADDREQFILDNQWAFKYGAMMEFGERDDHIDDDGEIISHTTIAKSIDNPKSETYRIMLDGEKVGGLILTIDKETHHNHLDILFVLPEAHSKGIGYGAWLAVESLHPETKVWETCTPILKSAISISMSTNAVFRSINFGVSIFSPNTKCPRMRSTISTKDLMKCSALSRL